MKKTILAMIMFTVCATAFSGQLGLATERIALPVVRGSHLVCIWDQSAGNWLASSHASYGNRGEITFHVPESGKWYWIGLWDEMNEEYVFSKWVGHFIMN